MSSMYSVARKGFLLLGVLITIGMWWISNGIATEFALRALESAGQTDVITPTFARIWAAVVATVIVAVPWIWFLHTRPGVTAPTASSNASKSGVDDA